MAVFADVKSSGGHHIKLDISSNSEYRLISVSHSPPSGMTTTVMSQPYYIVKINRTDLPIVFK
ncbi:hypothetical protein [Winogradskyella bathintestinalis]|uniref:hypothetical protein n=1 Tax=Winogradskyella bathintestinalis TaxID=3035208 RepID=UPI002DD66449|nr:hypothetical protein [Winogradskyella bathintestinalis]